jgi:PAS domain S-box-containing protein
MWKNQRIQQENIIIKIGDRGVVSRAAATGQTILINDVSQSSNVHPALPAIKAQLAVPLLVGNNLVGVLDVESEQVNTFSEDDRQIVQALADHLALAIENARLQKLIQRHLNEKTLLYESNVGLGISLEIDTVLKLMTQKITEAMDAGACVICLVDDRLSTITPLAEYVVRFPGNPSRTWRKPNTPVHLVNDPVGRQALKAVRPVINRAGSDKPAEEAIWRAPAGRSGRAPKWGVVLALPLESERRIIGLLEVYDKNPNRTFSADDIQLCRILATQTTLALERARLFDETRQRLSEVLALYTMAQKISERLDLQSVLDTIVVALRQVIGCRGCCIFLLDPSGEQLEIKAADGLKPQWRQMAKLRLGEGAAGLVAAENRAIYLPDTHKEPDFIFFDEEVRSLMVIPLVAKGKVIGTINVDDKNPNAFGPPEERLLTIAATQAGIAIDNARLFAEVSAERQQMQAIVQYTADGLLLIDRQGKIITCNPSLAEMLNLYSGEIIGQNIKSPDLPSNLASITAVTTKKSRTGVLSAEVAIQTPNPRTLQIFSTTVVDNNKNPVGEVRVVHDVTREREFEQLKDDFMSTVSHELRTPLFSIQGFVQIMLEDETLDPATRNEFLNIIQHQAGQLAEMVNNLLDISKLDAGLLEFERKPVAMLDLIHQTVLKLQGFAHRHKVKLNPRLPATLPLVIGDAPRLEQVLTNLIGNAIKFSEAEGQVFISASLSDKEVLIEVKDNGIGIPPEALERIFSRYYQVEDQSERSAMGSGLGLHIAQKIVEGHGGRIWAESEPGQGSTFRFTLRLPELETGL